MKKKDKPLANAAEIRRLAEERLTERQKSKKPAERLPGVTEDAQRLIQELQIHQIELEMQNEELQKSRAEVEELLDQYTDLYDFAPVGYFTLSREGEIRRVNLTGASLLETERAMLVNRRFGKYVFEADCPAFNQFLQNLFTKRDAASGKVSCEVALRERQNRTSSFESSGAQHVAEANQRHVLIEGSVTEDGQECRVVMTDITEQDKMDRVRDFLAKYSGPVQGEGFFELLARYLAEDLGMDFVCIDRLEGDGLTARTVAVWCDGKFEDNVSYALKDTPCGEVVGKAVCCFPASVCQFFPRDQVLQDLRAESYVGVTLWGHTGKPIGLIAVIGRRPLVSRRLAEVMLRLVAVRAAGEMERLDAEDALRENEERFRLLFENMTEGVALHKLIYDEPGKPKDYRILDANHAYERHTGISVERARGSLASVLYGTGSPPYLEEYMRVANTGVPLSFETYFPPLEKHFSISVIPHGQGQFATIFMDITERKLAAGRLQTSLTEKETMLKEIHHRVKNNLQVVSSLLDMQSSYLQDEEAKEALWASMARVKTMAMIHTQLYQSPDLARVDFGHFIQDLIGNISQSYGRAELPVEINVDADEIHLGIEASIPCGLILNELVANALEHAFPEGKLEATEGKIYITMRLEDNQVVLTVQDNGIGLPESIDVKNLKSLGLDLVNILVGQMNGTIDMQVDGGTKWTITFPVKNEREWRNG